MIWAFRSSAEKVCVSPEEPALSLSNGRRFSAAWFSQPVNLCLGLKKVAGAAALNAFGRFTVPTKVVPLIQSEFSASCFASAKAHDGVETVSTES